MPFLLLLVLMPACLEEAWNDPGFGIGSPARGAVLTAAAVAFAIAVSAVLAWWTRRRLWRHPDAREAILSRYGALRTYHMLGLLALHGLWMYVLGWGWFVQSLWQMAGQSFWPGLPTRHLPPGAEVLVLAPFLTALFGSWFFFYDVERAIHDTGGHPRAAPFWTRGQYLAFQLRHNLALVMLPIGLIVVLKAGLKLVRPLLHEDGWALGDTGVMAAGVLACYVFMPWALRLILRLRPLPAGPLRERLEAAARRLNFRCSDILLWNTRNGMANALVVGITPWLRYVVFTDRLLAELTPEEVEAVFGHEIGHVKHWHMPFYLAFLKASMLAVGALVLVGLSLLALAVPAPWWEGISHLLPYRDLVEWLAIGTLAGTYIFTVFGFISRRCERQADVYGCRAVSCGRSDCSGHESPAELAPDGQGLCPTGIHTFVNALEKVAYLNGISRRKPGFLQSWQHGSIARRVEYLLQMQADPALEPQFQRRFRSLKWGLLLGLLGLFAAAVLVIWLLSELPGPGGS